MAGPGGRFFKSLEFFEHYSVSWVFRLWKVAPFLSIAVFRGLKFRPRNTANAQSFEAAFDSCVKFTFF